MISVIIPCYNVEPFVDRCLKSVVEQTIGLEQLQIITVNDASLDGTLEKLLEWESRYPDNILVINNEVNARQGACRNIGMEYAAGDYISFIDADDWIEPAMYEKMLYAMEKSSCQVVHCQCTAETGFHLHSDIQKPELQMGEHLLITAEKRDAFIIDSILGSYVCAQLYRKEFLFNNEVFFPEKLIYEDVYFMGLLYAAVDDLYILYEELYHVFVNPGSVSRSRNRSNHSDIITVNRMLWQEFTDRGLMKKHKWALEYYFLIYYYLTGMKIMFLRFDEFPCEMFFQIQKDFKELMPDYKDNPYIKSGYGIEEVGRLWMRLIDIPMDEQQLMDIVNQMKSSMQGDNPA